MPLCTPAIAAEHARNGNSPVAQSLPLSRATCLTRFNIGEKCTPSLSEYEKPEVRQDERAAKSPPVKPHALLLLLSHCPWRLRVLQCFCRISNYIPLDVVVDTVLVKESPCYPAIASAVEKRRPKTSHQSIENKGDVAQNEAIRSLFKPITVLAIQPIEMA